MNPIAVLFNPPLIKNIWSKLLLSTLKSGAASPASLNITPPLAVKAPVTRAALLTERPAAPPRIKSSAEASHCINADAVAPKNLTS